ncbi:hypothetical protein CHU95_06320 [Niveispirillum lacus]|uniref:AsmA domain-containing protein n=1 Tax=Niveispirillum lacus TaxID=1981099 RepID=A0A255Z322_9PROT|nr:hypothetical protein CHU95_06320 [Niveispirillum lacus]
MALTLAAPAGASPEQAAALKDMLSRRLAESAISRDRLHVERVPDVAVTAKAGIYHLRIPMLRLAANDGWMVEAPLVEGDATPRPDGSWQLKLRVPQGLTLYGGNGFRLGDIALGRQALNLAISGDGRSLLSADLDIGNVSFKPALGAGTGSLSALRLVLTPKAMKDGVWSGRVSLTLDALTLKDPMGIDRLAMQRLRLEGGADGLDMRRMGNLLASGDRTHLDRIARTADLSADIAGFRQVRDDGTRSALEMGKGKLTLSGLSSAKAALSLDWTHEGLNHTGNRLSPDLLPVRASINLTGTSLPKALLTGAKPADGWTPSLAAAGSAIKLSKLTLWNPNVTILGQGDFRFSPGNTSGVAGNAALSLRGVDKIITGINQSMGAKGAALSIGLYALQGLGRLESGPMGTTHQYTLAITPQGQVTLNGTDATSLFRGLVAVN